MNCTTHDQLESTLRDVRLPEGTKVLEIGGQRSFEVRDDWRPDLAEDHPQRHSPNLKYVSMDGGDLGRPRPVYIAYLVKDWADKLLPMEDEERKLWRVPCYGVLFNLGEHLPREHVYEQCRQAAQIVREAEFKREEPPTSPERTPGQP